MAILVSLVVFRFYIFVFLHYPNLTKPGFLELSSEPPLGGGGGGP